MAMASAQNANPYARRLRDAREERRRAFDARQDGLIVMHGDYNDLHHKARRARRAQAKLRRRYPQYFRDGIARCLLLLVLLFGVATVTYLEEIYLRQTMIRIIGRSVTPSTAELFAWMGPVGIVLLDFGIGVMFARSRAAFASLDEAAGADYKIWRVVAVVQAAVVPAAIVARYMAKFDGTGLSTEDWAIAAFQIALGITAHVFVILLAPVLFDQACWATTRCRFGLDAASARRNEAGCDRRVVGARRTCHEMQGLNAAAEAAGEPALTFYRYACAVRHWVNATVMGFPFVPYGEDCAGFLARQATANASTTAENGTSGDSPNASPTPDAHSVTSAPAGSNGSHAIADQHDENTEVTGFTRNGNTADDKDNITTHDEQQTQPENGDPPDTAVDSPNAYLLRTLRRRAAEDDGALSSA